MRYLSKFVGTLAACAAGIGLAAPAMPPQLAPYDQAEYGSYLEAPDHRAFAIAPGGAYGWVSGQPDAASAEKNALAACQANTAQHCLRYSVDGHVEFDARAWSRLWGPYATARQARQRSVGTDVGQRFPDLAFADGDGRPHTLASLKGKVVLLHFWGAWCPPCRREMPELRALQASVADRKDVIFVPLQAREKYDEARAWARSNGIGLTLYDSGSAGDADAAFRLADGSRVNDRDIAARFPTSYVIDKNGVVVFAHVGPVVGWPHYQALMRDAAEHSGAK